MADPTETVAHVARKAFAPSANYENIRQDYPVEAVDFLLRKVGLRDHESMDVASTERPFKNLGGWLWYRKVYSRHGRSFES